MKIKTKETLYFSKTPYAELHLHLGGAIKPRMLWHKVQKDHKTLMGPKAPDKPIGDYHTYKEFQAFFDVEKENLAEYLKMHKLVEPIQNIDTLEYFINRLMRGAFEFENLSYIELRHCPWGRTSEHKTFTERVAEMKTIVEDMHKYMNKYSDRKNEEYYPIIMKQILCLHAQYSPEVNDAIFRLAKEMYGLGIVVGLDIAGGENKYNSKNPDLINYRKIISYFEQARSLGLKTTAHIFETEHTPVQMFDILPHLDRIGHGIQIPLKHKAQLKKIKEYDICLEVCPSTYNQYKTFTGYDDPKLKKVFDTCREHDVAVVIGTDNSGMHNTRLQSEFENLLIHEVVKHEQLEEYRLNAFRYAFGLTKFQKKMFTKGSKFHIDLPGYSLDIKI